MLLENGSASFSLHEISKESNIHKSTLKGPFVYRTLLEEAVRVRKFLVNVYQVFPVYKTSEGSPIYKSSLKGILSIKNSLKTYETSCVSRELLQSRLLF